MSADHPHCSPSVASTPALTASPAASRQVRPGGRRPGTAPPRSAWVRAICTLLLTAFCGCASGLMNLSSKDFFALPDLRKKKTASVKESDNEFGTRVETPLLSEYISVQGNNLVVLRGVGLVTGLDGTGDNPPPSSLRTALRDEMSRRGIKDIERILSSKGTALVIVTALLPAMVTKDQRFDVRVALPPNSDATSLKGGWLLETRLFEEQTVEGRGTLKGHEYGVASGAILTELGVKRDQTQIAAELRRGSIPGGAISKTDRDLSIVLRADKRGYRNAKRISSAVAARFHDYDRYGRRIPLVNAKTDTLLELKLHKTYRNNFPRYQQVIRSIAFNESDVARRMRMESLEREIMDPATAQRAALQLEAIGEHGVPFLKRAMASEDFEVQFHAAQALAYLGDASGTAVLKKAVEEQPALRVYALAALSVIDDADAVVALRELMSEDMLETRYGAFRALQELDPNDPSLRQLEFENRFQLYLIDAQGEPMVHVTRRRCAEIVLFGADQPVRLPIVLTAGRHIRVIGDGSEHSVTVMKYAIDSDEPITTTVPNSLADIIRACGDLGATYPDLVQMLIEAEQQHNLTGQFGIDRLPQAGRLLFRDSDAGADGAEAAASPADSDDDGSRRVGTPAMIPNLYDRLEEDEISQHESAEKLSNLKFDDIGKESAESDNGDAADGTIGDESPANASAEPGARSAEATSDQSPSTDAATDSNRQSSSDADQSTTAPDSDATTQADGPEEPVADGEEEGKVEAVDLSKMRGNPLSRIRSLFRKSAE